jgi:spore germination cell wall hydrolase CwlJ-like protein
VKASQGMIAVGCVVRNRVIHNHSSYYAEIVKPWQFSSMTGGGNKTFYDFIGNDSYQPLAVFKADPGVVRFPHPENRENWAAWEECQKLAPEIMSGAIPDNTNGATHYFAVSIPLPNWAAEMQQTCQLGQHRFYRA